VYYLVVFAVIMGIGVFFRTSGEDGYMFLTKSVNSIKLCLLNINKGEVLMSVLVVLWFSTEYSCKRRRVMGKPRYLCSF
jgi:hypothetical protein